ncbi:hypothetical protein D920_01032 [Enterococcus faecalis 13-SD-W-01]|nr:hypothetical protein D920_01032 [Enterococcus faecalis 13-SD-W-01]
MLESKVNKGLRIGAGKKFLPKKQKNRWTLNGPASFFLIFSD